jgi:hypothetical protein
MKSEHRQRTALLAVSTLAMVLAVFPASAYVGPGAGLTLLGALWGLILAVVMSVGFVILWPFRRLLRRRKREAAPQTGEAMEHVDDNPESTMLANPSERREER